MNALTFEWFIITDDLYISFKKEIKIRFCVRISACFCFHNDVIYYSSLTLHKLCISHIANRLLISYIFF